MADIVSFNSWRKNVKEKDFNFLLKQAIEISRKIEESVQNELFVPSCKISDIFAAKFNQVLLDNKAIDSELFRCALYVAALFEKMSKEVPESYYGVDFYIRGLEEGKPEWFRRGGDVCFLVCSLFEGFARRRTSVKEFQRMGAYLYNLYFEGTRREIGWCMSNNFKSMVQVAQQGISRL
jgi:hypothetical protein